MLTEDDVRRIIREENETAVTIAGIRERMRVGGYTSKAEIERDGKILKEYTDKLIKRRQ